MPENHDRHKGKKDLVYKRDSTGENYVIPHFDSDTSCVSIDEHCLHAVPEDSSNVKGDISQTEFSKDDSNLLQAAPNATKNFLLHQTESSKIQDVSFLHSDINVDITKETLDEEDEIVSGMRSVVSIGKELSLLSRAKSFTEGKDHSLGTSQENCSLQESGLSISVVDQEAADIVYDTLRLMNEVLQLESEIPQRKQSTADAEIQEPQLPKLTTSGIENDSVLNTHSLFATQEVSSIRGQSPSNNKDEISSLFHSAPLIFPETSDIAISMTTASVTKKKSSRSPTKTPRLSDAENGITCDCAEITKTAFIDSRSGNPSDSSLTDSNARHFHIVVETHPDGGWGWVVCLGAFLVQFIALGMQNTAGIVYTELVKELKSQRGATGSYQIHVLSLLL